MQGVLKSNQNHSKSYAKLLKIKALRNKENLANGRHIEPHHHMQSKNKLDNSKCSRSRICKQNEAI